MHKYGGGKKSASSYATSRSEHRQLESSVNFYYFSVPVVCGDCERSGTVRRTSAAALLCKAVQDAATGRSDDAAARRRHPRQNTRAAAATTSSRIVARLQLLCLRVAGTLEISKEKKTRALLRCARSPSLPFLSIAGVTNLVRGQRISGRATQTVTAAILWHPGTLFAPSRPSLEPRRSWPPFFCPFRTNRQKLYAAYRIPGSGCQFDKADTGKRPVCLLFNIVPIVTRLTMRLTTWNNVNGIWSCLYSLVWNPSYNFTHYHSTE